ncbi:MAG: glycosyltransferase family 2 protein [Verrucomicrobiota bacterium]|nr:glycosyltransferase family 2 protein [Verrucomicrobiota bacterium]
MLKKELPLLSIVIPLYNEQDVLPLLIQKIYDFKSHFDSPLEFIIVNDGSKDNTSTLLDQLSENLPTLKVLHLSRNFGHQIALTAGIDYSTGEYVVVMDGDLQDPFDMILPMMQKAQEEGYDIVLARRRLRDGETLFKLFTAKIFYWIMKKVIQAELPSNVGDFRLMNRKSIDALKEMKELHRFLRGMVVWIGFKQAILDFDRPSRPIGKSKYPLIKMLSFSWNAITSFSTFPLYIVMSSGCLVVILGISYSLLTLYKSLILKITVPGWASLVILLCIFSGVILVSLGIVGLYVGKIFEQVKGRPLYLLSDTRNITSEK